MNTHIDLRDDLVYAFAEGEVDFSSSVRMFEHALQLAAEKRVSKIILDGLLLSGELTDLERFDLAGC
jgi:hypothetical protein